MKRLVRLLFPSNTLRRRLLRAFLSRTGLRNYNFANYYNTWVYQHKALPPLEVIDPAVMTGPLISVIVPAYNTPQQSLLEMVYSVTSQAYRNWELILVDASNDKAASRRINDCAVIDTRIIITQTANKGIAANTNYGLAQATGEFIVLLDHDDVIEPFALYEIVKALQTTNSDLLYSDEDKISEDGQLFFDPFYKPDWSPDLLTHVNYINHLTAIRKSLLDSVGPLNPERDGAQDYDLYLRLVDAGAKVHHIPKVLYHWRAAQTSTAQNFTVKTNVTEAGVLALSEHYKRKKLPDITVRSKPDRPGFYETIFPPAAKCTVIILPFGSSALLRTYVTALLAYTDYRSTALQLIVSVEQLVHVPEQVALVQLAPTADYVAKALQAADNATVIMIDRPVIPKQLNWSAKLPGIMHLPHVRAAAPVITHNDSVLEDSGLVMGMDGLPVPLFANEPVSPHQTFLGNTDWVRDVDALTGAISVVRRDELVAFGKQHKQLNQHDLIRQYTLAARGDGAFSVILPDILFDDRAIRLQSPSLVAASFLNPGVFRTGNGYELYTLEPAAVQLLQQVAEAAPSRGETDNDA